MNDFLQSLRNGQSEKPRTPKTRKNSDNSYHYTSSPRFQSYGNGYQNNRSQHTKRPPVQSQPGNQIPMDETATTALLADAIETLSSHIETLTKNQDYMISVHERTADILERQATAIERIVDRLDMASEEETLPREDTVSEKTVTTPYSTAVQETEQRIDEPLRTPAELVKPSKPVVRRRKKVVAKKAETAAVTDTKLLGRDAVLDIIHTMRSEGATFDQVASRLVELGQPTFSGRGEWHAQTLQ